MAEAKRTSSRKPAKQSPARKPSAPEVKPEVKAAPKPESKKPEPAIEPGQVLLSSKHTCYALLTLVCASTGDALHFERKVELDYRPYENESLRIDGTLHKLEDIVQNADNGHLELILLRKQVPNGSEEAKDLVKLGWKQLNDDSIRG